MTFQSQIDRVADSASRDAIDLRAGRAYMQIAAWHAETTTALTGMSLADAKRFLYQRRASVSFKCRAECLDLQLLERIEHLETYPGR